MRKAFLVSGGRARRQFSLAVCGMDNAEYPERRGTGSLTVAAQSPYSVFPSRDR